MPSRYRERKPEATEQERVVGDDAQKKQKAGHGSITRTLIFTYVNNFKKIINSSRCQPFRLNSTS